MADFGRHWEDDAWLKKKSVKEKRNILLTTCFFMTTLAWICLWSVMFVALYLQTFVEYSLYEGHVPMYLLTTFQRQFVELYAVINPVIFLTVNRKFQAPLGKLYHLIKRK